MDTNQQETVSMSAIICEVLLSAILDISMAPGSKLCFYVVEMTRLLHYSLV